MSEKIAQAISILCQMNVPEAQHNERSALTLLALLQLGEETAWAAAQSPRLGIRAILDFCRNIYQRPYAENTRESFRKETLHQFVAHGLVLQNPDNPQRAPNSPKWCYQISPEALAVVAAFATNDWAIRLNAWREKAADLSQHYQAQRDRQRLPCRLSGGGILQLSPGQHSQLIRDVVEQFAPRFAPGSVVLYVGDTGDKNLIRADAPLKQLGITVHERGKMPDVILHYVEKNWLLLIEAVSSVGPMDAKRYAELSHLFSTSSAGLVFVTAFPDRALMKRFLADIAWETEVWVASEPDHLIHFNGDRFLGPHS